MSRQPAVISGTEMRVLEIVRGLTSSQAEIWLRMGRRIVAGTPFAEAKALFERELAS